MLSFGFYNSKGGDRKYDAEQIGAMFNGLITDGVFANYKEALRVTSGAGKREIVVRPGRAWFNGTWTEVDDGGHSIHLGTSFAVDDTFYICLAVSKKSRLNSIAYYKDIPENNPDTGLYYYLLAQINIPAGSDRIMDSMITDTRGSDLCPYVTGIMETVSFEELVKQVCGDSWQDWLGVYEAGITTGVQNAIRASSEALSEVKSLKAYSVESEAVSYTWAKFEAIATGGGGFEWATDSVHTKLVDPPMPMCLFRDLSYADLGAGFKPSISLGSPYKPDGETTIKPVPASTQAKVWKEYPYFWEGGGAYGTEVLRYDDLQRGIVISAGVATVKYRYRISRLVHLPVTYEPGAYMGTVTADNATAYPRDGYKDGYWYKRFAAKAEDVSFYYPGLSAKNVQDAIIEVARTGGTGGGSAMSVIEVEELPATGIPGVMYVVKKSGDSDAVEYLWLDRWEKIGSTGSGQNLALDTSLSQSGKAADAKATGDEIKRVEGKIPNIEGLAKTEDIPTKPDDIGAQPAGNYALKTEIPAVPVQSVNGKTGAVVLGASDVGALPDTYTPPDQTAAQVGADPKGTAATAVSGHNTSTDAHTDLRLEVKALREQLAAFLDVDEETLNELSELIARIVANQKSIEQLTTGKVNVSDIVDNLTTNVVDKPISAAQGVAIKALIDGLSSGKLDASKLSEAINTALAQAKASGEFDGDKGDPGQAATLEITGATALAYGAAPTVTEVAGSTAQARKYKLGIPAGKPGGGEDETPTVVLPRKLYAVAGHEYVLYYANILRAMRPEDFVVTATFADSSALLALKPLYSNMLRFTPTADHVGEHSITITVKSRRTWATVAAKTVTLIISADATRTDRRVMFIGDSLTYASVYAAEIQRMSGDGIMAVGTVSHAISFDGGSVRIESEGRNSAASYDYVSKQSFAGYSNPFYNPGVEYSLELDKKYTSSLLTLDDSGSVSQLRHHFDFAYYMVNNGATVGELDAVFINLGTNGGNKSAYESVYIAFDAMIERIRAYSSDLPIFVHMFPPKSEAGSTDRGTNGTFSGWVNERTWYYDIIQTFIDRYDNDPRVIVVPTYTMLDPVFDYKRETVAASARSTDTITIGQTDGTHPATSGYLHMADSYYNALQALWSGAADTRYYSVTYNLGANVSSSNTTTTVAEGASYSATLTAKDGYDLDTVSVTMGGSAVAVTGGSISISAVTGDIIITATAAEVPSGPANLVDPSTANDTNPNLALDADEWVNNYTVSGSNETMALVASSGRFVSDMFPISDDAKVRIKGMDMSSAKRASNKLLIIMSDGRIFRGMAMPIGEAGTTAVDQDLIASEGTMLVTISKFGQAASWPGKAYARVMGYAKNGDNSNVFVTVE